MDDRPYRSIADLYKFLLEKQGSLDAIDISYMTGVLKTLVDLYASESDQPIEKPPFKLTDIFTR